MRFPCLDTVDTEKKNIRWTRRKEKRTAATMKGAVEENAATENGALLFYNRHFISKRTVHFQKRKKRGQLVRKREVAEVESQTGGEQRLAKTGVAR